MVKIFSTEESLKRRLGSDTRFPINGDFNPVSGTALLIQDIEQLLLTIPGERVYRPTFGSALMSSIWENMDDAETEGAGAIRVALEQFEPRITVNSIRTQVNSNSGLILFTIIFTINNTDEKLSLIFPFRTGTSLSFA